MSKIVIGLILILVAIWGGSFSFRLFVEVKEEEWCGLPIVLTSLFVALIGFIFCVYGIGGE